MKNNQISLDQNYHFLNQNNLNDQLHNPIQNDEYQQLISMNKKQNNLINNGGFIVNSNNLNSTQHNNQQPIPKASYLNLTNPEEEKQRKMNMYKQELLTQIEKEKIKKNEQKKLDKIKEEEEERKINEYWERKKKLVNDTKLRNKEKLNGDDDFYLTNTRKNEKENKMNNSNLGNDLHSSRLDNDDNVNSRRRVQIKVKEDNEKNREINTSQGNIEKINQNYFVNSPIRFDYYMRQKLLKDELNTQMLSLRQDISKQTRELNEYILNLKSEVVEAKRLKFEAENQLYSIREEINKKKANEAIFEVTFNKILEKNAPYNNLHIPIHEVHPIEIKRKRKEDEERLVNGKLNSKSEFIYMNDDDLIRNFRNDNKNKSDVVVKSLEGNSEFIHNNESSIRRSNTNNLNFHNNDIENNNEEDFIDKLKHGNFYKKENNENLLITSIPQTYPIEFKNNEEDDNEDKFKDKFQKHLSEIKKMNNKYITNTKIREIDSYLDNLLIKKN